MYFSSVSYEIHRSLQYADSANPIYKDLIFENLPVKVAPESP